MHVAGHRVCVCMCVAGQSLYLCSFLLIPSFQLSLSFSPSFSFSVLLFLFFSFQISPFPFLSFHLSLPVSLLCSLFHLDSFLHSVFSFLIHPSALCYYFFSSPISFVSLFFSHSDIHSYSAILSPCPFPHY